MTAPSRAACSASLLGDRRPASRAAGPGRPEKGATLNLAWGLAAIAAATLLFCAAWRAWRAGRPELAAAAIVAAGLVLRMYAGCDLFLHTWDERYHALVAKHLVEHPLVPTLYDHPLLPYDYRNWRANHVWLHKPPLALWLMAAGMRLLGPDEIAMRVPSLLLSALAILLTWIIGTHLAGPRAGLLAAACQAANGYLLQLPAGRVAVDHVDNALVFFVELGICCAVLAARSRRGWQAWLATLAIGFACGLAVLTKWLPGLLPIPVWLALVWNRQPRRRTTAALVLIAAAAAAVALPWQVHVGDAFPREAQWESAYNLRHLVVPIEGLGGSPLYYLAHMPRYFGELIYLPFVWFLAILVRPAWRPARTAVADPAAPAAGRGRERPLALAPVAVWLLLPYAAFSLAATKLGGYVMIAAPALFLVEASFWLWLWDGRARATGAAAPPAAAPEGTGEAPVAAPAAPRRRPAARGREVLRWAVLVLLPLLPLHYTIERLKIRPGYDRNPAWARALRELPARLGPGPVVLFHLDRPIEAMFYTPYTAYPDLPTLEQARRLGRAGYRIVVLDGQAAPAALRQVPGVELWPYAIPAGPLDDGTGYRPPRRDGSDSPLAGTTGR